MQQVRLTKARERRRICLANCADSLRGDVTHDVVVVHHEHEALRALAGCRSPRRNGPLRGPGTSWHFQGPIRPTPAQ